MKVLFLTHRLPYAPNRGDRNRAYHLLNAMSQFAEVSLCSLINDDEEASYTNRVPFAHHVTGATGGHGAAREFCDLLLVAGGRYAGLLESYA